MSDAGERQNTLRFDDTRDRLIVLEVHVQHLTKLTSDQAVKINEMHEALMEVRGGRKALLALLAAASAFGGTVVAFLKWKLGG